MGKYSSKLIGRKPPVEDIGIAPEVPEIAPETPGMMDIFTGAARETEQTRALPEFRETPEAYGTKATQSIANTLKMTAGMMFSMGDEKSMDIIKENIPGAKFERDEKGNVIVDIDGEKSVLNKPGWSGQDSVRALTQVLAFMTPSKLAGMAKGVMAKFGAGAAGAGLTEAGIQEIEKMAGSKEKRSAGRIVGAAALGGAGEMVGPVLGRAREARQAKRLQVAKQDIADVATSLAEARKAEAKTGIELAFPQKTAVPAQLEEMSFVAQLPAGTKKSMQFLRKQNVQASDAVEAYMGTLAPPEALTKGAEQFRTASQRAVEATKIARKEKTSFLFNAAFKDKSKIDTSGIHKSITAVLEDFPETGEVARSLKKVAGHIGKDRTLKQLQGAKLEIDQMINKFGENALGNTTKRQILDVKTQLVDLMKSKSPEYDEARRLFAAESGPVEKMQESIIGKIADISDTQLKTISRRIFDPAETNVQTIRNAKKVISDVDPGAWDGLMRVELERRMGAMAGDIADAGIGVVENIPGQLHRAIFKPSKQKNVLYAALDGESKENLKYLETALKRASLGRPGGSPTAGREEIKKRLRGGIVQSVRNFFKSPVDTLVSTGEDIDFNKRVRDLSEVLFSPEYKIRMRKIRKMNPHSSAALKAFSQLLNDAEND